MNAAPSPPGGSRLDDASREARPRRRAWLAPVAAVVLLLALGLVLKEQFLPHQLRVGESGPLPHDVLACSTGDDLRDADANMRGDSDGTVRCGVIPASTPVMAMAASETLDGKKLVALEIQGAVHPWPGEIDKHYRTGASQFRLVVCTLRDFKHGYSRPPGERGRDPDQAPVAAVPWGSGAAAVGQRVTLTGEGTSCWYLKDLVEWVTVFNDELRGALDPAVGRASRSNLMDNMQCGPIGPFDAPIQVTVKEIRLPTREEKEIGIPALLRVQFANGSAYWITELSARPN